MCKVMRKAAEIGPAEAMKKRDTTVSRHTMVGDLAALVAGAQRRGLGRRIQEFEATEAIAFSNSCVI